MKKFQLTYLLLVSAVLVLLIIQNTVSIQAHFLWFTADVPVIVLLFLTALGGFITGLHFTLLRKSSPISK